MREARDGGLDAGHRQVSGIRPPSRGSVHGVLDAARAAVRFRAASKRGLWVAASVSPAPAQSRYRETASTPAATKASPSPALTAWNAILMVCRLEAQKRLMVAAGTLSRPARMVTTLAMLDPASPLGSAQPR